MKKLIYSLFLMAVAAMTFTACSNVPEPYENPNSGKETPKPEIKGDPSGKGTVEEPYNVAAALQQIKALKADGKTPEMYVKGIIVEVKDVEIKTYGNASYYIADSKDGTEKLYIYQSLYLGKEKFKAKDQIKVGDEVVVCGPFVNFKGKTPETEGKGASYLYSLNGKKAGGETPDKPKAEGDGTEASPYNVSAAQDQKTGTTGYVKGYIVGYIYGKSIKTGAIFNADTCTVETNLLVAAKKDETNPSNCLTIQLPKGKIRDGLNLKAHKGNLKQEIVLYGDIADYYGQKGLKNLSYAKISSTEFGVKPGTVPPAVAKGTGTLADPYNATAATEAAKKLGTGQTSTEDVYIKGKISEVQYVFSKKYGTAAFKISDDGQVPNSFIIFGTYYLENKPWVEGNEQIKVGDEVIICGKLTNYKGTYETASKKNYIYSLNGKTK